MLKKNTYIIIIFFILLLLDAIASGMASPETTQFFISAEASTHNLIFNTGFLIILSPIYIIAAPIIGHFSDQHGRKRFLLLSYSFAVIAFSLSLAGQVMNSVDITIVANLLYGFSNCCFPLILAAICDISKYRQRLFFFACTIFTLSFVVFGNYLGSYLFTTQLHTPYLKHISIKLAIVLEMINLIIALICLPKLFIPRPYGKKQIQFHGVAQHIVRALMVKGTRRYLIWLFGFCLAWGMYSQTIYDVLRRFHNFTRQSATNYQLSSFALFAMTCPLLLTPLARLLKKQPKKSLCVCNCIITVCLAFILLTHMSALTYWIITIPLNIGFGITLILLWYGLAQSCADRHFGIIMGLQGGIWAFAWAIGNITANLFKTSASNYVHLEQYFVIIVITMLLVTISTWRSATKL